MIRKILKYTVLIVWLSIVLRLFWSCTCYIHYNQPIGIPITFEEDDATNL